jgi:hypothetical protein
VRVTPRPIVGVVLRREPGTQITQAGMVQTAATS